MTAAPVTLGGSGGGGGGGGQGIHSVVGAEAVDQLVIGAFHGKASASTSGRRSYTDMLPKDAAVGWSVVPALALRECARVRLGQRPAAARRGMVPVEGN